MPRRLYLAWVYAMIGLWTLVVFPSSVVVTLATGSHRLGHRIHAAFWGRAILHSCGVRLRVYGVEQLRADAAYVLMINHNSHLAGYAVAAGIPLQWRAVLALKLRKIPVFAWIALLAGHVFIDTRRTPRAIATLNAAAEKIRGGLSVLIFPEGRYHDGSELLPFRNGGFYLAVRAGVPIVPLTAVEHRRSGAGRSIRQIDLYVGASIPTIGKTDDEVAMLAKQTRRAIAERLTDRPNDGEIADNPAS